MPTNQDTTTAPGLDATVRIEHDRKRLLLRLAAAGASLLAMGVALVITLLHAGDFIAHPTGVHDVDALLPHYVTQVPRWAPIILVLTLAGGCAGLLRIIFRLQDADPALVISPRGVRFRPTLFGDVAQIPWSAIRGLKLRRYKQQRYIDFQVDGIDRYVSRLGLRGRLHRLLRGGEYGIATLSSPMSRTAWKNTGELLERYLAHYRSAPGVDGG
jgi:hypothetical protein